MPARGKRETVGKVAWPASVAGRRKGQFQWSCVIQPSVGATCRVEAKRRRERLRWVNGQNEHNARCGGGGRAQARRLFDILGSGFDPKKLMGIGATKARPFVSPMVWALYSAYSAIVMQAVAKLLVLQSGVPSKIIDQVKVAKLIKIALPDHSSYVDKFGDAGYHYLLDELEERLLNEINRMLAGKESDKASLDQAAAILRQSNEVVASLKVTKTPE
jgi:hypothetical protein